MWYGHRFVLDFLRIRGLALLDDVSLEFRLGMNVLTGETGAGKSIIVDALELLRGGRGRVNLVRQGAQEARVEAQFRPDARVAERLNRVLSAQDLELEEGMLVVGRRIGAASRSRSFVQGGLTTRKVLADISGELIEICSQHEHHSLTHVSHHLELLDVYGGLEARVSEHRELYRRWRQADDRLESLKERVDEGQARADYLRFQVDELERISPRQGEYAELDNRLALLRDAAELGGFARDAHEALYEADDSIASRLALLLERARRGPESLATLGEIAEQLETAQIACEEAAAAASRLGKDLVFEPYELETAEERIHELERLRRKHGCEADELVAKLEEMRQELETVERSDDAIAELQEDVRLALSRCLLVAEDLSGRRRRAAKGLQLAIEGELHALHIPDARLEVRFRSALDHPGPQGIDRMEIMFSANAGEPVAALTEVASGGELSRVLLAFKSVLSTDDRVSTYVFDEVDAGVGGAVAEAIGERLRAASRERQVLCITHLPQIAAFADVHFRVEKHRVDGRTVTRVVQLDAEQRIEELARMLGGARVTASARRHAAALIDDARSGKGAPSTPQASPVKATPSLKKAKKSTSSRRRSTASPSRR